MKLNTYTMHYDYDYDCVRESYAGENGNWVHIVAARELLAENERLRDLLARVRSEHADDLPEHTRNDIDAALAAGDH